MRNLLVLLLVFGFAGVAGATSPYDDFEAPKTVGQLVGQGGGLGFTGNWNDATQINVAAETDNQFWRYTADGGSYGTNRLFTPLAADTQYTVYIKFRASQKGGNAADEWATDSPSHFQLRKDEGADPLHLKINQSNYFMFNDGNVMGMDDVPDWYTDGGHTQAEIDDYYMNYVNQWAPWKFELDLAAQTIDWYWMDNSGNWDLVASRGMGNAGDVTGVEIDRIALAGKCNVNDVTMDFDDFYVVPASGIRKAWAPIPEDESERVSTLTDLSWMIPTDANELKEEYRVYFSTDSTFSSTTPIDVGPLSTKNAVRASVTNAEIAGPLTSETTYYWRVDCVDPNATPVWRIGGLWSFESGVVPPTLIAPTSVPDVEINVDLEWSSDPLVTASRLYIKKETDGTWNNRGIQTSPYNPWDDLGDTMMAWDTKYLWKIEELDGGNNVIATGSEWNFTVRELSCDEGTTADIDGTGDCVVDLADFAEMASQWLRCGWDDGGKASPCP